MLTREVIGVLLSSGSVSPATTLLVSNLSCWTKHLSNVSFPSPSILSQVLPSSLCLAYTTIPPTWQPSPHNLNFCLVAVYFVSVLPLIYKSTCSPGLLLSLISLSLSSPQRKHLCSLSTIRPGSTPVASLLFALSDGLRMVLFFPSYMRTRFNSFPPYWMVHHNFEVRGGL